MRNRDHPRGKKKSPPTRPPDTHTHTLSDLISTAAAKAAFLDTATRVLPPPALPAAVAAFESKMIELAAAAITPSYAADAAAELADAMKGGLGLEKEREK